MYRLQCTGHSVQATVYRLQCTGYSVQATVYRLQCTGYSVQATRALYSVAPNTMAKPVTKTPRGREQCHVNGYTLGHLRGHTKWLTGAPIRLFYEKALILNQAIASLRRSVGLPGRFVTV